MGRLLVIFLPRTMEADMKMMPRRIRTAEVIVEVVIFPERRFA